MWIEMTFLVVIVVFWSGVLGRTAKQTANDAGRGKLGYFRPLQYLTFVALLFGFVNRFVMHMVPNLYDNDRMVHAGIALAAVGVALFYKAKADLGKHFSPCYLQQIPLEIVTTGIYGIIRHPIYVSNALIIMGFAMATASPLVFLCAAGLIAAYIHSALLEEQALLKSHREHYSAYVTKSGRFFPRVPSLRDFI